VAQRQNVKLGGGLTGVVEGSGKTGRAIITHGAGRGLDATLLEKTAERLAELGFKVLRFNFDYIGKRPAPSALGKKEQGELVEAIDYMKGSGPLIIAGKSFGARVASYVAAERADIDTLVFYGLPLQGIKATKPRDWSHLEKLKGHVLFITGDNDKLCPLDELKKVQKSMRCRWESKIVKGDHSFKPKSEDTAVELCIEWLRSLYGM
jgi:predicted alpha/beta-hydrolase family hydrolase